MAAGNFDFLKEHAPVSHEPAAAAERAFAGHLPSPRTTIKKQEHATMRTILFLLILSALLASILSPAMAGDKKPGLTPVFLYNPSTRDIKPRCFEVLGKHDRFPHYECFDQDNSLKPFDPGKTWEPLALTNACLKHVTTGTIKACAAYRLKNETDPRYVCLDRQTGKYIHFPVGTDWQPLQDPEGACAERTFGPDVIRHFEFDLDPDALKQTK